MPLWQIDTYDNRDDASPFRSGYVNADTESEALEAAKNAMGDASRADLTIKASSVASLPRDHVLWVS